MTRNKMKPYPLVDDLLRPLPRVTMPRAARLDAPDGTIHPVARGNNREVCFTTVEDFERLIALLREMSRSDDVTLDAWPTRAIPAGPRSAPSGAPRS